jgi:hypothetical protein
MNAELKSSPTPAAPKLNPSTGGEESSQSLPTIQPIHTSCAKCVFAQYEGKTQTGCTLNRLKGFGDAVVEAYDEEGEFFVVNGRRCVAYRPKDSEWATKHEGDPVAAVKAELALKLALIIPLPAQPSLHDLARTVESLKSQSKLPQEVFFVHDRGVSPKVVHPFLWQSLGNLVTWRMVAVLSEDASEGEKVDAAVNAVKASGFYTVVRPGFALPTDFVAQLDDALNERLERFCVLTPEESGNALTVQLAFHNHYLMRGNAPLEVGDEEGNKQVLHTLAEKASYLAEKLEQPELVRPVRSVCPNI